MNIENAVDRLATHNFNPRLNVLGEDIQIRGYLKRRKDEDSKAKPRLCFVITYWGDCWVGLLPGAMPYNTVISCSPDLAEVVEGVCDFYNARETTTNDGMSFVEGVQLLETGGMTFSGVYENLVWGEAHRQVKTPDGLISKSFCIDWHFDAWLAIYITLETKSRPIKYSKSLGDVVQAVLDFYRERDEARPEN